MTLTAEIDQEAIKQNETLKSNYIDHKAEYEVKTAELAEIMAFRQIEVARLKDELA